MKEQIEKLIRESNIERERLLGIGMGIPGVIDYKKRFSVLIERITEWENVFIGEVIEDYIGRPVYISNDVKLLYWAERKIAHLEGISDMLYIIIRSGIGMAVWTDGRVLQGEMGNSGRIGHMSVDKNGPRCKCGSNGCFGLYFHSSVWRRQFHLLFYPSDNNL